MPDETATAIAERIRRPSVIGPNQRAVDVKAREVRVLLRAIEGLEPEHRDDEQMRRLERLLREWRGLAR
jgi:hypothetical protein